MTEDNQPQTKIAAGSSTWQRFLSFFIHTPAPSEAHELYAASVRNARYPVYYDALKVPDTPEGRFEILALHVGLVIRRLMQDRAVGGATAQALIDLMIADMDVNLRELGVGDLSVGKQVKRLAGQLNARIDVLTKAFDSGDHELLRPMLATNAYHGVDAPPADGAQAIMRALEAIELCLASQDIRDLAAGRIRLPDQETIIKTIKPT